MRPQSFRQSVVLALFFTLIWAVIDRQFGGADTLAQTLISLPIFFAIILFTMRATNRLTVALMGRFGPKPKAPPPPKARSTDRPEHVSRRRERRRRRAGR